MNTSEYIEFIKTQFPTAVESNLCPHELTEEGWTNICKLTILMDGNVMSVLSNGDRKLICYWN